MSLTIRRDPRTDVLHLEGVFAFDYHKVFREATQPLLESPTTRDIRIDLSGLSYLDSSSLGLLLLLRDQTMARKIKVILLNPSPTVAKIFAVVQFSNYFEIVDKA